MTQPKTEIELREMLATLLAMDARVQPPGMMPGGTPGPPLDSRVKARN